MSVFANCINTDNINRTQENCIEAIQTVKAVLDKANCTNEKLEGLAENFENRVSERFSKFEGNVRDEVSLENIGGDIQRAMLFETAYTLNGQEILQELNLSDFGAGGVLLNNGDMKDLINVSADSLKIEHKALNGGAIIDDFDNFEADFIYCCTFELADMYRYDIEGDKNTGELLTDFRDAIEASYENGDFSLSDMAHAVLTRNNHGDKECYDRIRDLIEDRVQENHKGWKDTSWNEGIEDY